NLDSGSAPKWPAICISIIVYSFPLNHLMVIKKITNHLKKKQGILLSMSEVFFSENNGNPLPLGATRGEGGWNFAIYSQNDVLSLCLASMKAPDKLKEFPLDPVKNRTGSIYHVFIKTEELSLYYGYKVKNHEKIYLIDPYAKLLDTGTEFGNNFWGKKKLYGIATEEFPFDWEGDLQPDIPHNELAIYEMHVR